MKSGIRISVLADNNVLAGNAIGEHGLSFCIDTGDKCILFDTGQGRALSTNAELLGIGLDAVDTVVLSHGHYDHTGGLGKVIRFANKSVNVFAHPDAILLRYYRGDNGMRDIGMPLDSKSSLLSERSKLVTSRQPLEIAADIWTTGEIPRKHMEEAISEPFFLDPDGTTPDPIMDDQAMYILTDQGTVVLLGCAHSGVVNILDHISSLTGDKPFRAVIGGMHLRASNEVRLKWTLKQFQRFDIRSISPMHCTGHKAFSAIFTAFPDICRPCGAGLVMNF